MTTKNDHLLGRSLAVKGSASWPGLELRHLQALHAIAVHGTFAAAAAALGYSQSAVSQQIQVLERVTGERLFERPRGRRRVALTETGAVVLRHGEAMLARVHALQADLESLRRGEGACLRIGTYQSAGARIMPLLLPAFRDHWAAVDIQLKEAALDTDLIDLVASGALDICFAILPLDDDPFEYVELLRDPYVLLVPRNSPLATRERPPSLRDLASEPLIGFSHCRSLAQVCGYLEARGIRPNFVFRSDDNTTVQSMVAAEVGAALIPQLAVDQADERVVALELGHRLPDRVLALAWHRDRRLGSAARGFIDLTQRVCADLPGGGRDTGAT